MLNNCAQSTALMGPTIAIGSSGNIYQAGLSYGANQTIFETTGKTPVEHVAKYVEEKSTEKKRRKLISNLLETHIKSTREKSFLQSRKGISPNHDP